VGDARFEDAHTIAIRSGATLSLVHAERTLISTGSSPYRPACFPFDRPGVYDSDTILELNTIPKSLAVVGTGAVGSEYACTFGALGTKVHLIDSRDVLLPFLDSEVSAALTRAMGANGIELHWGERVAECNCEEDEITLTLQSGRIVHTEAVSSAKKRSGLHLLRDFASSCRMWLVPAHPLAPFLTCRRRGRESVPSQTARFVSRAQGEASTFERCHTRLHGLALQVLRLA
jgi:hypothetical protein